MQVIGTAAFNFGMLIYAAIQVYQIDQLRTGVLSAANHNKDKSLEWLYAAFPVSVVAFVCMLVFSLYGAWLARKVYREYGWSLFENNGASLERKRMQTTYNVFDLLLKFSIYFNFGIVIQVAAALTFDQIDATTPNLTKAQSVAVWGVGAALVLIALFYYYLGRLAVTRCSTVLMVCFLFLVSVNIVGLAVGLIYVRDDRFKFTIFFLSFFVYLTIIMNVANFAYGIFCWSYFEDGLKDLGEPFFLKKIGL